MHRWSARAAAELEARLRRGGARRRLTAMSRGLELLFWLQMGASTASAPPAKRSAAEIAPYPPMQYLPRCRLYNSSRSLERRIVQICSGVLHKFGL